MVEAKDIPLVEGFTALQKLIHATAKAKGWWSPGKTFGEQLLLVHAEISEAVEEYRNGHDPNETYYNDGKPEGVPIELADAVIRIMDTAEYYKINLLDAILIKVAYNQTRSQRHGGKVI